MKKFLLNLCGIAIFLAISGESLFAQGTTTASLRGRVTDESGEGLIGATVLAVHEPTGTKWGNVTDYDGYFRLSALRVGGPYTVTVTYVGFETYEQTGINLSLGQTLNINVELSESATELSEVVVTGNRNDVFDGNRTGAETYVGLERINATPTVSRSIGDFARFTPQASIEEGNDGLSISIGGQNNRYNAIYIDGAVNNDVFGLAGSGTNGGQTGVSPISLDAIEQFQISVAPFDVRQSGFAGGSINAITRSGSNELKASAYTLYRNESMAGITPQEEGQDFDREKLEEFTAQTSGAWVAGPVVKDKVFFFVSAELQRDETPQPFNLAQYNGNADQGDINRLVNHLNTAYDYDPGTFTENTAFLNSDKLLAKFDFNLNPNNKLTLRHSYTTAENLEARASSGGGIRFLNGSEYFNSVTNSSALELKSQIGNSMFNHLTIGSTLVRDDRDPYNNTNEGPSQPFPWVSIDDGNGGFTFGDERFSTANLLDQDILTINNNFEYFRGRHTFTFGANLEFYRSKNLFIPFNYGAYEWDRSTPIGVSDLDDFINGEPSDFFIRSYSLKDNVVGDESAAGVEFSGASYGIYVQDELQLNEKLKLTLGLRGDVQTFEDTPANEAFNQSTIPILSEFYDLKGAETGDFIQPQLYISPRFGFNYDVFGDKTAQLRGGAGIFTSRIPLVWPGGAYNNNGLNRGTVLGFGDVLFEPNINNQPPGDVNVNDPQPSGDVDLFADDFKVPQVAKFNLAFDRKLPWGIVATLEGLYTKTINNVYYQNVNLRPAEENLTGGPDDRPIFDRRDEIDDTYGRIILATNTSKGYSYNFSGQLQKSFDKGFSGSVAYSYGDAYSIYDGTSSQNSSQWRGLYSVRGRNNQNDLQRSGFSQGSRIISQFSYTKEYAGFMSSQISVVYEGRSGNPYTYIYGSGDDITQEDSRNRTLIWIPANASDVNLIDIEEDGVVVSSAAQQWSQLNEFIENDPYLSENRGQYAEANSNRLPFQGTLDLRILQNFYLEMSNGKRNTLQLSLDIFNFTNLLNNSWGKRYFGNSFELLEFEGFEDDGTTPRFTYEPINEEAVNEPYYGNLDDRGIVSSRWQAQVGIRYIFGN